MRVPAYPLFSYLLHPRGLNRTEMFRDTLSRDLNHSHMQGAAVFLQPN